MDSKLEQAVRSFQLNSKEFGDTESFMFKHGYGRVNEPEARIFFYLGQAVFDKLVLGSFEYSCLEREYLQQMTKTDIPKDAFGTMCIVNRTRMLILVCQQLPLIYNPERRIFDFQMASPTEMKREIMAKYRNPKDVRRLIRIIMQKKERPKERKDFDDGEDWKYA